jgi:hypothetical protein
MIDTGRLRQKQGDGMASNEKTAHSAKALGDLLVYRGYRQRNNSRKTQQRQQARTLLEFTWWKKNGTALAFTDLEPISKPAPGGVYDQ